MRAALLLLVFLALAELIVTQEERPPEEVEEESLGEEEEESPKKEAKKEEKMMKKKKKPYSWTCEGCPQLSTGWCKGTNGKLQTNVWLVNGPFSSAKECAAAVKRDDPNATGGVLYRLRKKCYGMTREITMGSGCAGHAGYTCFKL